MSKKRRLDELGASVGAGAPVDTEQDESPVRKRPPVEFRSARYARLLMHDHEDGQELALGSGTREGRTFHAVTVKSFKTMADYVHHLEQTGMTLEEPGTGGRMLSRRGSVGGFQVNPRTGVVDSFRISSAATSRALEAGPQHALAAYDKQAADIEAGVVNSAGNRVSTNVVESEAFHLEHRPGQGFQFSELPRFAQGTSATGLSKKISAQQRKELYELSIETMRSLGIKATDAATLHSEPMALRLMGPIREGSVVMTTSSPNDMCVNCGRTYAHNLGPRSIASAMGGRPFGGQHEGFDGFLRSGDSAALREGGTVFRAQPTEKSRARADNLSQVQALVSSAPTFLTGTKPSSRRR